MTIQVPTRRQIMIGAASFAATLFLTRTPAVAETAFLGFDLWCGVPGAKFGSPVSKKVGSRSIAGPQKWRHPITKKEILVYVRTNVEAKGKKIQYYTMREDGTALARVFDRRPGQPDRVFVNDAFIPIGTWSTDQQRKYTIVEYQNGRKRKLVVTLKVLDPNYTKRGVKKSVKYDWIQRKPSGRIVFHERFFFSPGIGFVDYDNML